MAPSLLFLLLFLLHRSSATDRLSPGESITANQTLLSSSGTVVLGFFSPSNVTSLSYLGIWLSGADVRTAIWVANREAPVPLSRAVFRLSKSSNLEVADSNGTVIWSSGTSPSHPNNTVAVLLDVGNLKLLRLDGSAELWQSFDHPTDTALPGMPIWANYKTHKAVTGVSWRSPVDPSPGKFYLSIDPYTPFQVVVTKRGFRKWWRSNVWAGAYYTTRGTGGNLPYLSFSLDTNWWNMSFASTNLLGGMLRLDSSGNIAVRLWVPSSKVWYPLYTDPLPCASYGLCGAFGYCSQTQPTCRCLDGFEPRNRSEWDGGDHRGGCVRKHSLACDGTDELVRLENMKMPDYNVYLRDVGNGSACMERCRSNCSCVAYAYRDLFTGSEKVSRCLVWGGELLDLVFRNDSSGEDLYVKVHIHPSPSESKKKGNKLVIMIVAVPVGFTFLAAVTCFFLWKCRRTKHTPKKKGGEDQLAFNNTEDGEGIADLNGFGVEIDQGSQDTLFLNYGTIVTATNNFSDANKIGQGGFGIVYKGKLPGGEEVAIKRLSEQSSQGLVEFKNEIALIAKLQHRNLVRLLSCCVHGEEKLLIYEYMPNRSLELLLFGNERHGMLDWGKRFNIIKGIARGLLYLHEDSRLKIIHRDLKASNILLDADLNPKISDFGMARIFESSQSQANTKRVVGTYGYISPEYAMEGLFSVKSDVYSFGVLLLEIISGRRNTSFHVDAAFPSLLSYAWKSWRNGNLREILAPSLSDSVDSLHEVAKCIHIGLLCVQDDPTDRPNMSYVVFMLEKDTPITSTPEKPNFTSWTCKEDTTQQIRNSKVVSANSLTMSEIDGR